MMHHVSLSFSFSLSSLLTFHSLRYLILRSFREGRRGSSYSNRLDSSFSVMHIYIFVYTLQVVCFDFVILFISVSFQFFFFFLFTRSHPCHDISFPLSFFTVRLPSFASCLCSSYIYLIDFFLFFLLDSGRFEVQVLQVQVQVATDSDSRKIAFFTLISACSSRTALIIGIYSECESDYRMIEWGTNSTTTRLSFHRFYVQFLRNYA